MTGQQSVAEFSSGGVVYRYNNGRIEIVAVQRARHGDWSLPKGHIEAGESREQAALREVQEETGIDGRIIAPLEEVNYFFRRRGGDLVNKTVYHYLIEALNEKLGPPNWEVAEARWVDIEQAGGLLTYEKDRGVVTKALAMLRSEQ